MIHVFTVANINYLPKVRLLCQSLKKFHPDLMVHLALADRRPEWFTTSDEPFDNIITMDQLDIENLNQWLFFHDIVELSAAIRPFVLKKLLNIEGCEGVIYFDPDMVIFSALDDLLEQLKNASIILTPHQTKPEKTLEAIKDNEITSLQYGIFNLGFFGVSPSPEGQAFADWWANRLYYFCHDDLRAGLFVDQKWVNLVPIYFENVVVLKSSRFNVAVWNISTRHVFGDFEKGFWVDGEPLGFYHFSRFDSGGYKHMVMKYGSGNQSLLLLTDWYTRESKKDVNTRFLNCKWAYGTYNNGASITKNERILLRSRPDLQQIFVDPFSTVNENTFYHHYRSLRMRIARLKKEWRSGIIHQCSQLLRKKIKTSFRSSWIHHCILEKLAVFSRKKHYLVPNGRDNMNE